MGNTITFLPLKNMKLTTQKRVNIAGSGLLFLERPAYNVFAGIRELNGHQFPNADKNFRVAHCA